MTAPSSEPADECRVTLFGHDVVVASVSDSPEKVARQVAAYERGERRTFDLDVSFPSGFLGDVCRAMAAIPYGETRTYGDIAADLDTAPVAVGGACGRNPTPIVVPCHRVVAAAGLGGYSAGDDGPALKRRLLEHEGVALSDSAP